MEVSKSSCSAGMGMRRQAPVQGRGTVQWNHLHEKQFGHVYQLCKCRNPLTLHISTFYKLIPQIYLSNCKFTLSETVHCSMVYNNKQLEII